MYGDALATHLRDGVPELEARQKALDPALRAGLITAAVTYAGGPRGVEAFFRQAEGRELLKRTIWERGRAFGRHFKEEALEESTDNFLQGLNEMMSYSPGKSLDEVMKQTWEGFWMGGTLGGSMGAVRGGGGKGVHGDGTASEMPQSLEGGFAPRSGGTISGDVFPRGVMSPDTWQNDQGAVSNGVQNSVGGAAAGGASTGAQPGSAASSSDAQQTGIGATPEQPQQSDAPVPALIGAPNVNEESNHAVPPGDAGGGPGMGGDVSPSSTDTGASVPMNGQESWEDANATNDILRTPGEATQAKVDASTTAQERIAQADKLLGKGLTVAQKKSLALAAEIYDGNAGLSWKTTVMESMYGPLAAKRGIEAHKRVLQKFEEALFNVLTQERRKAIVSKFREQGRSWKDAQNLVTAFHEQVRQLSEANSLLDESTIESDLEKLYYKTFGEAAIPRAESLDESLPTQIAHQAEREATRLYEDALKAAEHHPARDAMEGKARTDFMNRLNSINVGPTHFKWGNPTSGPTYRHVFIDHGRKTGTRSIVDRTATEGTQVGRYLDDDLAAAYVGAIAKRGPGVHDVPLPRGLHTEVALVNRSVTIGDMMRVVVADDGHVVASYPFRSDQPTITTRHKKRKK